MVRAKFKVQRIERFLWSKDKEVQSIVLLPVAGGADASEENRAFFAATPTGEIKLGTVNAEAAAFELGGEYYVDFTPAE